MDEIQRKFIEETKTLPFNVRQIVRACVLDKKELSDIINLVPLTKKEVLFCLDFLVVQLGKQMYEDSINQHSN